MNIRASSSHRAALVILAAFTAVAVIGFAVFGRHPQLIADSPNLLAFYAVSFRLFAQAHIVIAAAVLIYYLVRTVGWAWLPALGFAYVASLAAELVGTTTGLPFGEYAYSSLLGWKWLGHVPALIPLSWFLMAVPAYVLSRRRFPDRLPLQWLLGAALLTAWDLALDPAMSSLTSYWMWGESGPYYGMPLVNLLGWMVTGGAIMALLHVAGGPRWSDVPSPRWMAAYYVLTIAMPLGMIAAAGMWLAVVLTLFVAGGLLLFAMLPGAGRPTGRNHNLPELHDAARTSAFLPSRAFIQQRADEVGAAHDYFRHHSRSFSFASRWFGAEERRLITGLYAFCRMTDDLIDRAPTDDKNEVEARLHCWRELVDRAYADGSSGIPWLDAIMTASAERGVPRALPHDLIKGVRMDAGVVRIQDWPELERYMYRVASVVGIWMCHLFGVTDPWAHRRAAALGQAMQLTNILRDVGEDLEQDRVYLPADVLERYGLAVDDLQRMADGEAVSAAYRALMHELIGRADALYELAEPGFADLPRGFRRAAAVAAAVYRGIHREIRRNGYDNVRRRAATNFSQKVVLATRALIKLPRIRAERRTSPARGVKVVKHPVSTACVTLLIAAAVFVVSPARTAGTAAACPDISEVRDGYLTAVESEEAVDGTLSAIEGCDRELYQAYEAALVTLKAKHAFWPHKKLSYVRKGLDRLDGLVRAHPANAEIRYLRLLSCYFLPSFFGREWSVKEDLHALEVLLPEVRSEFPPDLYDEMLRFVQGATS